MRRSPFLFMFGPDILLITLMPTSSCAHPVPFGRLLLVVVLPVAVLFACKPEASRENEVLQHYPSGELQRRHSEIDGKKEGGALREVQYYVDGKLNGGDTLFYADGKPEFVRTFDMGKLNGEVRKFSREGGVIFEAKYKLDTLIEANGKPIARDSLGNIR